MPQRNCAACQTENEMTALRCSRCGSVLSRLRSGDLFQDRFLQTDILATRESWIVHRVLADSDRQPAELREYFPSKPLTREHLARVVRLAPSLEQGRGGLPQLLEWFQAEGCLYVLETERPQPSLAAAARLEEGAAVQLFWKLVDILEGLSESPALYHGFVEPSTVCWSSGRDAVLAEPRVLFDVAEKGTIPSAADSLRDLPKAALTVLSVITGVPAEELAQDSGKRENAIGELKGKDLAAVLEWVSQAGAAPASFQDLRSFRQHLKSFSEARTRQDWAEARNALGRAAALHQSAILEAWKERLEREEREAKARSQSDRQGSVTNAAAGAAPGTRAEGKTAGATMPPVAPPAEPAASRAGASGASAASTQPVPPPEHRQRLRPEPRPTQQPWAVRKRLWLAAPAAAVVLLAWRLWSPNLSEFQAAIDAGRLLGDNSAYSQHMAAQSDPRRVQKMNEIAQPFLKKYADNLFDTWYRESEIKMTTWKEAAQALEWISKIEPDTAELRARRHYTLARVALDSKDNQQALAEFERALAAKPDWDMALLGKGIAYIRMQAEPVAEQYYLKTVQVSPNWVFPRHNLAELYIKQTSMSRDRLAEAEAQAREAVRIAPNRATSQELLGRILYFESRFDEACRTLGRALELAAGQQARFDRRQVERRFRHACGKASGQ